MSTLSPIKKALLAAFVAALLLLPVMPLFDRPAALMDEGTLLVYPELILKGKLPYRDFETFYGPANIYTLAGVYSVFGTGIFQERSLGLLYRLAIVGAMFALVRRWGLIIAIGCVQIIWALMLPLDIAAYAWLGGVAAALWSLWLGTSSGGIKRMFFSGLLAAVTLLFRPDMGPAVILSAAPILFLQAKRERLLYGAGFVCGLLPLGLLTLAVGPIAMWDNLFLYPVVYSSPGRRLPFADAELWLKFLLCVHVLATLLNLAVSVASLRADRRSLDARVILCVSLFALGISHQALQRLDFTHILFGCFLSIGFLPVTMSRAAELWAGRSEGASRALLSVAAVLIILESACPTLVGHYQHMMLRSLGFENVPLIYLKQKDRVFPMNSKEAVDLAGKLLSALERIAKPGDRLFVGPYDLRRTNSSDTFIYYLMPELTPASYFLEMNPFSANRPNSRLAGDVASADWLILDHRWDYWTEPNASTRYGPDAPSKVVQSQFGLVGKYEYFDLFKKKGLAAKR